MRPRSLLWIASQWYGSGGLRGRPERRTYQRYCLGGRPEQAADLAKQFLRAAGESGTWLITVYHDLKRVYETDYFMSGLPFGAGAQPAGPGGVGPSGLIPHPPAGRPGDARPDGPAGTSSGSP